MEWGICETSYHPRLRVHAVLVADVEEGMRRRSGGLPPVLPGDLFGASNVAEFGPCATMSPVYCVNVQPRFHILMDGVFQGCGGTPGTCTYADPPPTRCQAWTSNHPSVTAVFEQSCASNEGHYLEGTCPTEGLVGGCRYNEALPDLSRLTDWYYAPLTVEEVRTICSAHGKTEPVNKTFVDPPI
jgi:hypothetical protein